MHDHSLSKTSRHTECVQEPPYGSKSEKLFYKQHSAQFWSKVANFCFLFPQSICYAVTKSIPWYVLLPLSSVAKRKGRSEEHLNKRGSRVHSGPPSSFQKSHSPVCMILQHRDPSSPYFLRYYASTELREEAPKPSCFSV